MLDIRWSEPTRRHVGFLSSHISPNRIRGIIVNDTRKQIYFLFLFILFILFYFETYVPGFSDLYVEMMSLQILLLAKKKISWVKCHTKRESVAYSCQNKAVLRNDTIKLFFFASNKKKDNAKFVLASSYTLRRILGLIWRGSKKKTKT